MSYLLLAIVVVIVISVDSAPKYSSLQNMDSIPDSQSIDKFKDIADDASYSDDYLFDDSIVINLRSVNETTIPAGSNNYMEINLRSLNDTTIPAASNDSIEINLRTLNKTTVKAPSNYSTGINLRSVSKTIPAAETNLSNLSKTTVPAGSDGYIFDENICKEVNGRILCGYDKNKEEYTEATIDDLGNDCSLRGGRIECGYKVKQLNNTNIKSPHLRENEEPLAGTLIVAEKHKVECSKEDVLTPDKIQLSISESVDSSPSPSPSMVNRTLPADMRALHIDVSLKEVVTTPDQTQTSTSKVMVTITSPIALTSISTVESNAPNLETVQIISKKVVKIPGHMQSDTNKTADALSTHTTISTSKDLDSTTPPTPTVLSSNTVSTISSFKATNSTRVIAEVIAGIPVSTLIDNLNENEIIPVDLIGTKEEMDHQRPKRHTSDENFETTQIDSYTRNEKFLPSKLQLTKEEASKVKTVCVEQDDRIVCYDLLEE